MRSNHKNDIILNIFLLVFMGVLFIPGKGIARDQYVINVEAAASDIGSVATGSLFEIRNAAGFPRVWNTYRSTPIDNLHFFVVNDEEAISINALPKSDQSVKTAYLYADKDQMFLLDTVTDETYKYNEEKESFENLNRAYGQRLGKFYDENSVFGYEYDLGYHIYECRDENCTLVKINSGTWPYAFAEKNGAILTGTNAGHVLIFNKEAGWCRAKDKNEDHVFKYSPDDQNMPEKANGYQFYTSINYGDKTLFGEYPSGALYEFDGTALFPSQISPPGFSVEERPGYEAQAFASYCGDLYVGYWPYGDLWIKKINHDAWERKRLFTHPDRDHAKENGFFPYFNEPDEGWHENNFFGQRVNSLILNGPDLYASASNKSGWGDKISPSFMNAEQQAEYGTIHRIHKKGCLTSYVPELETLRRDPNNTIEFKFVITRQQIEIYVDGQRVGVAKNHGVVPEENMTVTWAGGIFGSLRGMTISNIYP